MIDFPVIDRIRKVRRKISEEHGLDTEKLIRHYDEMQKKTKRKFFRRDTCIQERKVA